LFSTNRLFKEKDERKGNWGLSSPDQSKKNTPGFQTEAGLASGPLLQVASGTRSFLVFVMGEEGPGFIYFLVMFAQKACAKLPRQDFFEVENFLIFEVLENVKRETRQKGPFILKDERKGRDGWLLYPGGPLGLGVCVPQYAFWGQRGKGEHPFPNNEFFVFYSKLHLLYIYPHRTDESHATSNMGTINTVIHDIDFNFCFYRTFLTFPIFRFGKPTKKSCLGNYRVSDYQAQRHKHKRVS
jgi:hypothetical protein